MTEELQPSIGYPEFLRDHAFPTFRKFFEICNNVMEALDKLALRSGPRRDKAQIVIRHLCLMTGMSFSDVALLVGNGCGLGAMKITRTAFEFAVNAEYLRLFPAEAEPFLEWNWIEQRRRLKYMQQHMPAAFAAIDSAKIAKTNRMYQEVLPNFTVDGKKRQGWCKLSLRARAAKTDFEDAYNVIYVTGSEITHGSFAGIAQHLEVIEGDKLKIAVQPSMVACPQALSGSHYCAYRAVHTLTQIFGIESDPSFESLTRDFEYAWNEKPGVVKPSDS